MKTIKLPTATYEYDPAKPLGKRGGFGQVFVGRTADGNEVAVKKLHVSADDAGHRELRIADELKGKGFEHVVPFIDSGEDADSGEYYVVMAKAEKSLQAAIDRGRPLDAPETAAVLLDLVKGLLEVNELVHRDLKPDNVLLHERKWKIADFGIARFIEEVTATNTLKECLSPYYAAPEQWRYERSTHATDVYALGCIAFFLLTGKPPFTKDPEQEHQNEPLPAFSCADSRLQALIVMMVRKLPAVRPRLSRILEVLTDVVSRPQPAAAGGAFGELASAGAEIAKKEQEREAHQQAKQSERKKRYQLAQAGLEIISESLERFWGKVHALAPNATRKSAGTFQCHLGDALLEVKRIEEFVEAGKFVSSGWDVVVWMEVSITQRRPHYVWSSSLWYAKLAADQDYRWYEASYWSLGENAGFEPFACQTLEDADLAAGPGMCAIQFALRPVVIDDEKEEEFHDRWLWLFAKASKAQLRRPTGMPINTWPPT